VRRGRGVGRSRTPMGGGRGGGDERAGWPSGRRRRRPGTGRRRRRGSATAPADACSHRRSAPCARPARRPSPPRRSSFRRAPPAVRLSESLTKTGNSVGASSKAPPFLYKNCELAARTGTHQSAIQLPVVVIA
jgi:hypothetical protein